MSAWEWPGARISWVVDGQTVVAQLTRDLGFGGTATFPVVLRLNRISAPGRDTPEGQAAYERLLEVIGDELVHVTTVKSFRPDSEEADLGEYTAEIRLPNGTSVSDLLVTEELAEYLCDDH